MDIVNSYLTKALTLVDCHIDLLKIQFAKNDFVLAKDSNGEMLSVETLQNQNLHWTANIVDLVELAYACVEVKCINNGEINVKELIRVFSILFNCQVKRCHDVFSEIRKRYGDRTDFIDKMKLKLIERMEAADNKYRRRK